MVGKSLSHYKIVSELGRGGMGIVYKAEDTKLDRTVAIKVLPSAALSSEEDRARFYREAKAAAQLHHPHIASVFEIDEATPSDAPHGTEPSPFIAMEYIEGETLHERIQQGPLKIKEAVRIGREIASALEAAHEKGIVHRDIKAANVMLTEKGSAKVLDFGLAQTAQSTKLTRMGSTLGTVAYMSPEQARGEEVDLKTDLWSLGAVLYEMVAGRSPFPGDYEQAVVYEILNQEPEPLTAVRTGVPMDLEAVVNKCLAKDTEYRYVSASSLIVDLKRVEASSAVRTTGITTQIRTAAASSAQVPAPDPAQPPVPGYKLPWMPLAVAAAVILSLGVFLGKVVFEEEPDTRPVVKTHLNLPNALSPLQATITPDDRALFFVVVDPEDGRQRLAMYDFESGEQSVVPGTDDAASPVSSPDGRWIAFIKLNSFQWWRISTSGGTPIEIPGAQSRNDVSGSYAPNGDFIFADTSWSISAVDRTGSSRILAARESGDAAPFLVVPVASPSGTFVTFSDVANSLPAQSWMFRPGESELEILLSGALIYSITSSGHALFSRGNVFQPQQTVAIPIDLESGAVLGEEVALGVRSYAVSPSGLLVFEDLSGQDLDQPSELYRVASSGAAELLFTLPGESSTNIAISGDGSMLLVSASETAGANTDMYRVNISNGIATRLTRDGFYDESTWGAGNEYVYFDYNAPDSSGIDWVIMRRRADGSGTNEPVLPDNLEGSDPDFTPDGSILVYRDLRLNDIWGYDTVADSIFPIVVDDLKQVKPAVSPDGKYVSYAQAGGEQCGSIHVSAVRSASEPIEIAPNGCLPIWSADGAFVYYQDNRSVSRIPVRTDPVFEILGVPEVVYTADISRPISAAGSLHYDVSDDGTLYVAHVPASTTVSQNIWVVNNWFEELNRLAPRSE